MSNVTPPGWKLVKFGDYVRKIQDRINDIESSNLKRYIAGGHIKEDTLTLLDWGMIGDGYTGPAFHMRFKPEQTLYKSRVPHGVAFSHFEGICANTTYIMEPKNKKFLKKLIPFILLTNSFKQYR